MDLVRAGRRALDLMRCGPSGQLSVCGGEGEGSAPIAEARLDEDAAGLETRDLVHPQAAPRARTAHHERRLALRARGSRRSAA